MAAPQTSASPIVERIGRFNVHGVASLFPLLTGDTYQELKQSLQDHGQQQPIIVQGDVLIDGRNRLKALLELEKEPVVEAYAGTLPVEEYILAANLHRRHLTDDQRMMITTQILRHKEAEAARERQHAAGETHGKGRPKLASKSTQAKRAPTTAQKIAAVAKGTEHQARQAIAVIKGAPELVEDVNTGKLLLREAAAVAKTGHREVIGINREGEAEAPPSTEHQANRTSGTRQHMREQAAKRRMIEWLSHLGGTCRGIENENTSMIAAALDVEEKHMWATQARKCSRIIHNFAQRLEAADGHPSRSRGVGAMTAAGD